MTTSGPATPRLPLIDTPEDPLARQQFAQLAASNGILNLHRMMAHAPALMKASGDLVAVFRRDTALARSVAELAILRTAQIVDCDYVWMRHLSLARACGVTERQLDDLQNRPDSAAFTPAQKAALAFSEQAVRRTPIEDEAFAALRRHFSPREIVELTMVVGFYLSTATFVKALAIPDEQT